jgi:DNA repair protein RecN (Recombination protein N)
MASGGELSRLMLCIKSLIAKNVALPTLVFDEIDNGISGETAQQVALLMRQIASTHQVICITHLPQMAAKADVHFYIYKELKQHKTHTLIKPLTNDERVIEIAKMLSGEKPGQAALQNAKELIDL